MISSDLLMREASRRRLVWFAKYMKGDAFSATPFHTSYYAILDAFARKKIYKLIVQAPPQIGKSEGSTRFLPAYILGLDPDIKIGVASYTSTVAEGFNRDVQRIIDTEKYARAFPDTSLNRKNVVAVSSGALRNSTTFEIVGRTGGLHAVGRGGPLTSKRIDVMIMDDLYKDAAEGNSPTIREAAWQWYTKVVLTRLHNESQQLLVFTRWHKDDIIGRILESGAPLKAITSLEDIDTIQRNEWAFINFEAIKTGKPTPIDPREEGQALWPKRHSKESLLEKRETDPVGFECLYQGNPGNSEGKLFDTFKTYADKSEYGTYVRSGCYVDVAESGKDFLCAVSYDIYRSPNRSWNEHRHRFEPIMYALVTGVEYTDKGTEVTYHTVPELINRSGCQRVWVESNAGGSQFEKNIKRKVRAVTKPFFQSQNKESRILTNASTVNQSIVFPLGWDAQYPKFYEHITGFLREFKANPHDDGVDVLTGIVEKELRSDTPYGRRRGITVR